nr:transposase [Methylobacterium sp. OTU13CASTA1]
MTRGLRLIYLPPYAPELQPAEHLWRLVDEPIANDDEPGRRQHPERTAGRSCQVAFLA